jgi:hypothetical protein
MAVFSCQKILNGVAVRDDRQIEVAIDFLNLADRDAEQNVADIERGVFRLVDGADRCEFRSC